MAIMLMIRCFLNFITNLATIIAGHQKSKKYNKCIPADFCDKPTCSIWKKAMYAKNAPVTEVKGSFLQID